MKFELFFAFFQGTVEPIYLYQNDSQKGNTH